MWAVSARRASALDDAEPVRHGGAPDVAGRWLWCSITRGRSARQRCGPSWAPICCFRSGHPSSSRWCRSSTRARSQTSLRCLDARWLPAVSAACERVRVAEVLILVLLIGPFVTSELNGDTISIGGRILPGVGHYDALSAVVAQFLFLIPVLSRSAVPSRHRRTMRKSCACSSLRASSTRCRCCSKSA